MIARDIVVAALVVLGVSCSDEALGDAASDQRLETEATAMPSELDELRGRPIELPELAADGTCPVTTEVASESADLGPLWGTAIARPVLGADGGVDFAPPENFGSVDWGGTKVLWALSTDTDGMALLRGRRLDGDGEVRFDELEPPALEKVLDPTDRPVLDGGWYDFPGFVRVREPGCYAIQVDTSTSSSSVVFPISAQ